MKKRLFMIGAALLACACTFAQGLAKFQKPKATDYQFDTELKPTLQERQWWEGDTTIYVLYNVEADAFFKQNTCPAHAKWATHGALHKEEGLQVMFAQNRIEPTLIVNVDTLVDGTGAEVITRDTLGWSEIVPWDGETLKILDYGQNSSGAWGWRGFFPTSMYNTFVDRGSQADFLWNVKDMGDGKFRMSVSPQNPTYNPALAEKVFGTQEAYMGFYWEDDDYSPDLDDPVMPLVPMLAADGRVAIPTDMIDSYNANGTIPALGSDPEAVEGHVVRQATVCIDWKLMPIAQYNLYRDHLKAWKYIDDGSLSAYIADVESNYSNIDLSAIKALANSTSAIGYSDIEKAIADVKADIRAFELSIIFADADKASPSNPLDVTTLMTNPDFSQGNTSGWILNYVKGKTVTNLGYQGANYKNGDVTISKFIEAWSNAAYSQATTKRALGDGSVYQVVPGLPSGKYRFTCDAIAVSQDNKSVRPEGAYLYAKSGDYLFQTPIATGDGAPEHFVVEFISVVEGGDFEFGFMTENTTANWMACDNFTLEFLGRSIVDDPYLAVLLARADEIEKEFPYMEDLKADCAVIDALKDAIEHARQVTDNFQEEKEALDAAYDALKASIVDYQNFALYIEQLAAKEEQFENSDFAALFDILDEMLMEWQDMYDNREATGEFIASCRDAMTQTIVKYITENVKPGDDITPLIINGDFDTDFSGWDTNGLTKPAYGGKGDQGDNILGDTPRLSSGNAEVYHNSFNMSQVIKDLPKGSYTVTVQAFERNDDGYMDHFAIGKEEGITTVLYGNEFETKIHNILAFARPDEVYHNANGDDGLGDWACDSHSDLYGYYPNSMDGANFHFSLSPETYCVKRNIVLAEQGDITIGLKTDSKNSWVIFDNFRLYYNGDTPEAYAEQIDETIALLEALFADALYYGKVYEQQAKEAIAQLEAARGDSEACIAAIQHAGKVMEDAKLSIQLNSKLYDAMVVLGNTLDEKQESATPEAIANASAVLDEMIDVLDEGNMDNEQVQELIDRATLATKELKKRQGEVDITELPWVNLQQDCINEIGNPEAGNVFGTDEGPKNSGVYDISYVDITGFTYINVYGPADLAKQEARFFINRKEYDANGIFPFEIIDGVCHWEIDQIYEKQPTAEFVHLNGIKAIKHGSTVAINLVTVSGDDNSIEEVYAPVTRPNSHTYNLAGQIVGKDYKGIVIRAGKKLLQK